MLRESAPAKINLYLHVTARRADGYHMLNSLVAFADCGDELEAAPSASLTLTIKGPFAGQVSSSDNNVIHAARALQKHSQITKGAALTLHKHLPVASGMGGGSADAAAALRLLMGLWNLHMEEETLDTLALKLGADVPACLRSKALYMNGIGESVTLLSSFPSLYCVLANPGVPLKTMEVFSAFKGNFSSEIKQPPVFSSTTDCIGFLKMAGNDLQTPAIAYRPEIANVLQALTQEKGCQLARMSGSGATCFGIFDTAETARAAAVSLGKKHATWWIREARLR